MPYGTANQHRSIIIGIQEGENLESGVSEWLARRSPATTFALAEMANPIRDGGQTELVLALDEIDPSLFLEMIEDLKLSPAGSVFESHAPHLSGSLQN